MRGLGRQLLFGGNRKEQGPRGAVDSNEAVLRVWDYYIGIPGMNPALLTFSPARRAKGMARFSEALKKTGGDYD